MEFQLSARTFAAEKSPQLTHKSEC